MSAAPAGTGTTGSHVAEFVIAAILGLLGVRSLVYWLKREFPATSFAEHVLYALHVTARVGTWFALSLGFVGYAVVAEPQRWRWFIVVILLLAAVQLLTAASLGLGAASRDRTARGRGERSDDPG